jgi:hypothetical protein
MLTITFLVEIASNHEAHISAVNWKSMLQQFKSAYIYSTATYVEEKE